MSLTTLALLGIDAAVVLVACAFFYVTLTLRGRLRRLRAQLTEERIAAAEEQRAILAVVTARCGHAVAFEALEAIARPSTRYELARGLLEASEC